MKYIFLFLACTLPCMLDARKSCSCESHSSGITTFYVDDGQPCCLGIYSGVADEAASIRTYAMDNDGVWVQTSLTFTHNTTAQNDCCH